MTTNKRLQAQKGPTSDIIFEKAKFKEKSK